MFCLLTERLRACIGRRAFLNFSWPLISLNLALYNIRSLKNKNSVMNSFTKSKLILRINSIICYNPRTLAGTILETSTISCCLLCTPIFIRTQIFYPWPIGRTFVRSFFDAVILYYMKMIFHKFVDKLNFF